MLVVNDVVKLGDKWPGNDLRRRFRAKVVKVLVDCDMSSIPMVRVERLDLKNHHRESWSQCFLEKEV